MIIDTADNTTKQLARLKKDGVTAIIRYDDRKASGAWKQIFPPEARAIAKAGIKLGIVYEDAGSTASSFSATTGHASAAYSRKMAVARGQPSGSAVYFAVDFDASAKVIRNSIIPYFAGVYRAFMETNGLPVLRVGAYCSGLCGDMLRAVHPEILIWITCSGGFAGSKGTVPAAPLEIVAATERFVAAGKQTLHQTKCDAMLHGLSVDYNTANAKDWGQFTPLEK
jgi:hypothetical protein